MADSLLEGLLALAVGPRLELVAPRLKDCEAPMRRGCAQDEESDRSCCVQLHPCALPPAPPPEARAPRSLAAKLKPRPVAGTRHPTHHSVSHVCEPGYTRFGVCTIAIIKIELVDIISLYLCHWRMHSAAAVLLVLGAAAVASGNELFSPIPPVVAALVKTLNAPGGVPHGRNCGWRSWVGTAIHHDEVGPEEIDSVRNDCVRA